MTFCLRQQTLDYVSYCIVDSESVIGKIHSKSTLNKRYCITIDTIYLTLSTLYDYEHRYISIALIEKYCLTLLVFVKLVWIEINL